MITLCYAMSNFSENLSRIMANRGINQVELAKMTGIKQPLISSYLRESKYAKFPSFKNLIKLAKALNCSLEELTGMKELKKVDESPEIKKDVLEFSELFGKLEETGKKAIVLLMKSMKKEGKKEKEDNQE